MGHAPLGAHGIKNGSIIYDAFYAVTWIAFKTNIIFHSHLPIHEDATFSSTDAVYSHTSR